MRLLRLRRRIGHGLHDDFARAGDRLRDILIRDFERETALVVEGWDYVVQLPLILWL
jgi:hypothetical protein